MKFDTKKCSPILLQPSGAPTGLDERDLVWRNPNHYLTDTDTDADNCDDDNDDESKADVINNNENSYGRNVEHIPRLIYTPVKVSARTKRNRSSSGAGDGGPSSHKARTVTDREMDELNASLLNLSFSVDENNNSDNDGNENCTGYSVQGRVNAGQFESNDRASAGVLGRIPSNHVSFKTGKATTVWRSARAVKKINRFY